MKKSIFLFHRDLRLEDNTGLIETLKQSEKVIPAFILDPAQLEKNPYRGDHVVQLMVESLNDLNGQLQKKGGRLYLFYGKTKEVIEQLIEQEKIDGFFSNNDYTPFAQKRDTNIEALCKKAGVKFYTFHDALLHPPGVVLKNDGKPYTVYTPYFRKASEIPVARIQENTHNNYFSGAIEGERPLSFLNELVPMNPKMAVKGGRKEGLDLLKHLKTQKAYQEERDFPALDSTTHLSAHHKFGTISVRESYHRAMELFGKNHGLVGELFWRDFFTQIGFHFPHVFRGAFRPQYDRIQWNENEAHFKAWCEGKTGFPIVDAGMRELNETGYMHNRVRMITASFLVKDLHIHWQKGERYFAQKLVDYDPAVNNGNWQWAASTGCDAQPYFRIFNPWRQQERFDKECQYIKKWIPELKDLSPKEIHKWAGPSLLAPDYPAPMVEHGVQAKRAKEMFSATKK